MPIDGLFHHVVIHHKSASNVLSQSITDVKPEAGLHGNCQCIVNINAQPEAVKPLPMTVEFQTGALHQ